MTDLTNEFVLLIMVEDALIQLRVLLLKLFEGRTIDDLVDGGPLKWV
jgi:hypothetical protein